MACGLQLHDSSRAVELPPPSKKRAHLEGEMVMKTTQYFGKMPLSGKTETINTCKTKQKQIYLIFPFHCDSVLSEKKICL